MDKRATIVIVIILCAVGFIAIIRGKAENHETVNITKEGAEYKIQFTGTRYLMVHDPISALLRKTYETTYSLKVPRIKGTVNGNEIPVKKGHYQFVGNVKFNKDIVIVDLYTDNYDDKTKNASSWNGKYTIIHNGN